MNAKIDNGLDIDGKPVSLKSVLEKDINKLNSVSGENHLNIDKFIHTIRKSLKSISAVLFKKLSLSSSADEYHRFRKWCKIYYHQQIILVRIGSEKMTRKNKKLYKITEFLGDEHNLQVFYQYLSTHFPELSRLSEGFFRSRIKRLRKKVLMLYPNIGN